MILFIVCTVIQMNNFFLHLNDNVYMTEHTDRGLNLDDFDPYDVIQEGKLWIGFWTTCNKELDLIRFNFFVIRLIWLVE